MNRNYIVAALGIVMLTACEKEIKVKVPEYQSKLVINSNTEVGDSFRVTIGKSMGILKYKAGQDLQIKDATVLLYEGNKLADTMRYDIFAGVYTSKILAKQGVSYSISAKVGNGQEATANTKVPSYVPIQSVQRIAKARLDIDGVQQDELRIKFTDPPGQGDYYVLSIIKPMDTLDEYGYTGCINTVDASVESIYNEEIDQNTCLDGGVIFIRDALFNGTTKELRLFVQSAYIEPYIIDGQTVNAIVVLRHVTEDYFRFKKSYKFASANAGNPFSEPTNVYTNVKNGYGVFSVMSYDEKEVK